MKTKLTLSSLLLSFLVLSGTINAQKIEERNFYKNNSELGGEITIENSVNTIIDNESHTYFNIESPSAGDYFINFWLMPVKHKDNTYSTYRVLVNGIFAGNIVPQKGNWQAIGLNNKRIIKLNRGNNTISVVAQMPELPSVEFVRLSKTMSRASISSEEERYNDYIERAKASADKSNNSGVKATSMSLYGDTLSDLGLMSSVASAWYGAPIAYTFWVKVMFYQGQEIFVTSASKNDHFIEFFNADILQFLSWIHRSEYAVNGGKNYIATVRAIIPQDGYYYVRARTYKNCSSSVADININGTHYYENAPLYTCGVLKQQGGNNNYYATYTKNTNTDLFMFIEGTAGRIVAYNDDVKTSDYAYASPYGVSGLNSFIRENYSMPACAVLVTTYSSTRSGTCDIYAGASTSQTRSLALDEPMAPVSMALNAQADTRSATSNEQIEVLPTRVYPSPAKLNSNINISSGEMIKNIEIYSLSGQRLNSVVVNANQVSLSLSDINISQTGMYILRIKTVSGVSTEKVMVN
ncbi:MAG: T9SS type A sorting domain-containing protein [Dysgonamonadaceae bacterium]|jgi:hypothetical protein|nr:T9SS type A sorting domain-containing protein [Dysgonamonadaceae bacterium]